MPPTTTVDTEDYDDIPIEELDLSVRTYNVLRRNGIRTVGQLLALDKVRLHNLPNLRERGYIEIHHRLMERGFI
jgi:DNA-directed RNA polymerase subunit alpha